MKKITSFALLAFIIASAAYASDFHGYLCTKDCSGHRAGYKWAQHNNIDKPEECRGKSQSFIEGCYAWIEEQQDTHKHLDMHIIENNISQPERDE